MGKRMNEWLFYNIDKHVAEVQDDYWDGTLMASQYTEKGV